MTAREEARRRCVEEMRPDFPHTAEALADVASDVWEPLLRAVVEECAPLAQTTGKGWEALRAAVKALGEER